MTAVPESTGPGGRFAVRWCPRGQGEGRREEGEGETAALRLVIFSGTVSGSNFFLDVPIVWSDTYRIRIEPVTDYVGSYSFVTGAANIEVFALPLGSVVSDGVPAAGAGHIEEIGSRDAYQFTIGSGRTLHFDAISGPPCGSLHWSLLDPAGNVLFAGNGPGCTNGDRFATTAVAGSYTLLVDGVNQALGTYSFQVVALPDQVFPIEPPILVGPNSPESGMGVIEASDATDIYVMELAAGASVCLNELSAQGCGFLWRFRRAGAPEDLFYQYLACVDGNLTKLVVSEPGLYLLIVEGIDGATGTYSFSLESSGLFDLDCNLSFDAGDLGALLGAWGTSDPAADLDANGVVDAVDLGILLAAWN